ncbi:MAG TPA: HAD family hydrolase, partial [Planctomycetia bacterium]|nr:HAD family hydrolase [Planctomycetia bacterium]
MMPPKAILFDAGFTLVDPRVPVNETYLEKARRAGATIEAEDFHPAFMKHWRRVVVDYRSANPELLSSEEMERAAWVDFTRDLAKQFPTLSDRFDEWHRGLVEHFDGPEAWRLVPGAEELLASLAARSIRVAVVSNWHSSLDGILEGLGIRRHFEFVLTSAE